MKPSAPSAIEFGHGAHDETLMQSRQRGAREPSRNGWSVSRCIRPTASWTRTRPAITRLAAQWLEKAALAHEVLGREDDWRACLDELIERHRRKYKLRPLLEKLRGR